jgi:hypothetical protein
MAQSITVVLTDDIDGSEATETVRFAIDGTWYEIDLNPGNAEKIREVFGEWIGSARRTGAAPSRPGSGSGSGGIRRSREANPENAAVREWAQAEGIQIGGHGRIPAHVREMYEQSRK